MRKVVYWSTASTVLVLAGIVGWAAPTTHARVVAPAATVRVDPLQLMTNTKNLAVDEFEDYSLVFH
jgi:hypothetical protein